MNELRELKRLLKFYDEARDNEKMTVKDQRELCKTYAEDQINKIIDGHAYKDLIKFDRRNNKITCEYYPCGGGQQYIEFKFFHKKCTMWNRVNTITLTIE